MDYIEYIILILLLTIIIIFYGGLNTIEMVEYNSNYFSNLNKIIFYEKKLKNININFDNKTFIDITNYTNTFKALIPNFVSCYSINIKSYKYFDIKNIIGDLNRKFLLMIIFNNDENRVNNLELILDTKDNINYNYPLINKVSITSLYNIYNNSSNTININIFIMKKPYWFY